MKTRGKDLDSPFKYGYSGIFCLCILLNVKHPLNGVTKTNGKSLKSTTAMVKVNKRTTDVREVVFAVHNEELLLPKLTFQKIH